MNVLFLMRSTVYVRNFESTLRLLASRGHRVHIAAESHEQLDAEKIARLCRECPGLTYGPPPPLRSRWSRLGLELRGALDYLRYLQPEYEHAARLRLRAALKAPAFVTAAIRRRPLTTAGGRRLLARVLGWCNRAVPRDSAIDVFVREHRPDVVLVTPLVEPGSPQSEYLRSARALGIRTGLCVYSWDNLTNKGLIHDPLDLVTVWNEAMKNEAVALHNVPADRVIVTGAAPYDHWFTWSPRTDRDTFCARVGLDPRRPYILYLCSSRAIARDEVPFVRQWLQELRGTSAVLRDVGILIRPHPQNAARWRDVDLSDVDGVTVWPRSDGNPVDAGSRADYFDSIYHSAAVVGVNTSAQIESAIVGRGVYTLFVPELREGQHGTLHFRHLVEVNGGLLHVAADFAEHAAQLEAAVRDPTAAAEKGRRFLEVFVRPYGLADAATPRLVAALEATAALGPQRPDRGPWWGVILRPALAWAAATLDTDPPLPAKVRKPKRAHRTREGRMPAAQAQPNAAGASVSGDTNRSAVAVPVGPQNIVTATPEPAPEIYERYRSVRDLLRPLRSAVPHEALTPSERQALASLQQLWDAPPAMIAALRRHCEAFTDVRAEAYDAPDDAFRARLERDLRRVLRTEDAPLWVNEAPVLGGFGLNGGGRLFNEDTLRYFRAYLLLQDAAVLPVRGDDGTRGTVWELGGGWGGFAYGLKTLCPNLTYLITAQPEQLLVIAVYLMTVFPTSTFRFYDPAAPEALWRDWHSVDFAFAPDSAVMELRPPSIELTVDIMALQRMSAARVQQHVERAYDAGSRYFLSLSAAAGSSSEGGSVIRSAVERRYWRHPMSAPAYTAKRLALRPAPAGAAFQDYFLGWRRLRP